MKHYGILSHRYDRTSTEPGEDYGQGDGQDVTQFCYQTSKNWHGADYRERHAAELDAKYHQSEVHPPTGDVSPDFWGGNGKQQPAQADPGGVTQRTGSADAPYPISNWPVKVKVER
jgi:hypothetical protein